MFFGEGGCYLRTEHMKYIAPLILIPTGFMCGFFQIWLWLILPAAVAFTIFYFGLCVMERRFALPDEDGWYVFFMLAIILGAVASLIFPEHIADDPLFSAHGLWMNIGGVISGIFGAFVGIASFPANQLKRSIVEQKITPHNFYIHEPLSTTDEYYDDASGYVFQPGVSDAQIIEAEERLRILLPRTLCEI